MKKKTLFSGVFPLVGALLLSSCGDETTPGHEGMGMIDPLVDLDAGMLSADVQSRAEETVTISDLSLVLTSADGSFKRSWESVSDFSSDEQFPIGEYTIEVAHANSEAEGFDIQPAYYDSKSVKVVEGVATPVSLTATRTHAMVSIDYTEAFKNYLNRANVDLVSASGKATTFVYSPTYTETRPAYIVAGDVTVKVEIEKKNGVKGSNLLAAEFKAEARHHYHLTIDVNEGGVGKAVLKVTFDEDVEGETVDVDLSDETISAPAPEIHLEGAVAGEQMSFIEGFYAGEPVRMSIIARGGIASVKMTTKSTYFRDLCAWGETIELVGIESTDRDRLTNHGFECRGLWNNPDRMAVIDFTKSLQEIIYFDSDVNGNVSTFTVSVVDKNGKTTDQDVTFSAKVDQMMIALSNPSELGFFGTKVALDMAFNGVNPEENVKFSYKNERGIDVALTAEKIEANGDNSYRVSLTGLPADEKALTITAACKSKTASVEVPRTPGEFGVTTADSDLDVFATRAYLTLTSPEYDATLLAKIASFWSLGASARSGAQQLKATRVGDSATFLVEGLTPAAANTVTVSLVDNPEIACEPIVINTEAATPLPNEGMEKWFSQIAPHSQTSGFGMTAYRWFANDEGEDFWATRNALTTSTSSGPTPYYVSFSGTVRVDGHNGKAAEISSLGYGEGSTFTAFGGIVKHKAAGMLFIGSHSASSETEEVIEYGKPFETRPFGLSFNYKFAPYNNESFKAYIVVENRDNGVVTELSRGELVSSEEVSEFKNAKIDLSYAQSSLKATHITVVFVSSTADNPAVKDVQGSKGAFGGYADSKRIGSVLTVDDIELIY